MKKSHIVILTVLVLAGIMYFIGGRTGPIRNAPPNPALPIVAFGDSLVYGDGAKSGEDYPAQLSHLCNCTVINKGIGGNTTHDGLQRIQRDILSLNPGLVIVTLGGNDMLQKLPRQQSNENLKQIIETIQDTGAMVALTEVLAPAFLNGYGPDYKIVAKETQSLLIPNILSGISTNPKLKSDQIHPNAAGYKIMADRVYDKLRNYIK